MTAQEARTLATEIAKHSDGVSVKFGQTNGQHVLHLVVRAIQGRPASSQTITEPWEWDDHPANKSVQRRKRDNIDPAILSAVANREAI